MNLNYEGWKKLASKNNATNHNVVSRKTVHRKPWPHIHNAHKSIGVESRAYSLNAVDSSTPSHPAFLRAPLSPSRPLPFSAKRLEITLRSSPHVLSFFSGHEAEGKFPVYEIGCSGLVSPPRCKIGSSGSSNGSGGGSTGGTDSIRDLGAATAEPCPGLAPEVLMPEVESACGGGGGGGSVGAACSVSFGTRREEDDNDCGGDRAGDWLSFSVCGTSGEKIRSLSLPAVTNEMLADARPTRPVS